jgi:hypothetical protein
MSGGPWRRGGSPFANATRIAARRGRRGAVAIDLDDLVVLEDQTVGPEEESLLERLFPGSFYVVGTEGNNLTTMNNLDLFHRVVEMIDQDTDLDDPEFREEVTAMLEDSDELSQEEYDEAAERSGADVDEEFEDEEEDKDKD